MAARWQEWWRHGLPYLQLLRLDRPADLLLLLFPGLWAAWIAAAGTPEFETLLSILLLVSALRCLAWLGYELHQRFEQRADKQTFNVWLYRLPRDLLGLSAVLFLAVLVLAGLLGSVPLLLTLGMLLLAAAYLPLRRRSFVSDLFLVMAAAGVAPLAYTAHTLEGGKLSGLLYVATTLWCLGWLLQQSLLRGSLSLRDGIKSLAVLFAPIGRWAITGLQLATLLSLRVTGAQGEYGIFFDLGLLTALALAIYQQYLMGRTESGGFRAAALNTLWMGLAIFCGISFHFLCKAQTAC